MAPLREGNGADEEARRRAAKSASAFRTISEVADELDVPQHVLRFWETKFPQIRPLKRGGGRRYYRPEDVDLLRRVAQLLYQEGYTIKGVQRLLREGQIKAAKPASSSAGTMLPLGLEEPEPEEIEPEADEHAPVPVPRPRAVRPAVPMAPITDPAARAMLRSLLEELTDLRDLLPRKRR
ncbi:MAG TPA: MerR family transcriptional regulator [Aliidongia sp.]|nr:MerR family transcriptional regulator [Aliidongia sp.]